ncbi:MAG: DNA polymerase III subunit delta [Anaerolineales bacterium]|nr:DNA polymerase III subunit delta [Anaerolineales bacterium]
MNMALLDGRTLRLSDLRQHTDSMPFLAPKRLVIVNGYLASLSGRGEGGEGDPTRITNPSSPDKSEQLQALVDHLGRMPPSTDLVLVETKTLDRSHLILKAAKAVGGEVTLFAISENLPGWIIRRATEHKAIIEPGAADILARRVGADLHTLNNELEKLALYTAGQRPITKADIDLLVPYTEEADQFGLSNAIGQRNARRAYDQLHKELDEGSNPMAILGSIAAQIRALIEVKDMAERGMSPAEIAKVKNWKSDYAATARLKEAANFSMARLEQTMEMLLEIDVAIKTGRMDSLLALDTLIARLCMR